MLHLPLLVKIPSSRTRALFVSLLACTEELITAPKIIQLLPNPFPTENFPPLSNPIPYREYLYLSISLFLFKLPVPNKQFSSAG